jgi:hypothetical protein
VRRLYVLHDLLRVYAAEQARLYREIGDRNREAETLAFLGDTHHGAGDAAEARDHGGAALEPFDRLGNPDAEQVRAKLRGQGVEAGAATG